MSSSESEASEKDLTLSELVDIHESANVPFPTPADLERMFATLAITINTLRLMDAISVDTTFEQASSVPFIEQNLSWRGIEERDGDEEHMHVRVSLWRTTSKVLHEIKNVERLIQVKKLEQECNVNCERLKVNLQAEIDASRSNKRRRVQ